MLVYSNHPLHDQRCNSCVILCSHALRGVGLHGAGYATDIEHVMQYVSIKSTVSRAYMLNCLEVMTYDVK